MPTLHSEAAEGANISDCIAKLSSLLEHALREGKAAGNPLSSDPHYYCLLPEPPLFAFSTPLLKELLDDGSVIAPNTGRLFSFINQHKDRIDLALETVSLKCLSIYLLRSSANDDFELGLYLLADEPEYITDSDSLRLPLKLHESGDISQLADSSLVQKTFAIFTNEERDARIRRMAGKVLTEIVYNCPDRYCRLLAKLNRNGPRPVIIALDDPDYVLTFFANTIIGVLCYLGANDRLHWEPNGPHWKTMNHIQTERDAVKQFHTYICEERQNRVNVCDKTRLDSTLPICYLIGLDETRSKGLSQHPALLLFNGDGINLIQLSKDVSGLKIDYMMIRLSRLTRTRCIFPNEHGGREWHLSLHIHADDIIAINDRKQAQKIMNLSITSRDDLTKIRKRFEAIGIRCQTNTRTSQSNRRSSSLVIPLDTDDEISSKSSQHSEEPSQVGMDSTPHHVRWRDEPANTIDRLADNAIGNTSQSSLTELTRTPTFHGTSPPRARENFHSQQNSPKCARGQWMEEGQRIPDIATESISSEESIDPSLKNKQAMEESIPQHEGSFGENGPAKNTRSRSSQNGKSVHTNTVLKPIPPNTQESLIFPKRRSRGKLYTAPTKTMVDWDEDLRASDRSAEPEPRRDAELASVSSPQSSGTGRAFNKSLKSRSAHSVRKKPATQHKRKARTGNKRKEKRRIYRQVKLSLSPPQSVKNYTRQSDFRADIFGVNDVENFDKPRKERGAPSDFSQGSRSASRTSHHSLSQESDTHNGQSTMETSFEGNRQFGGDNQGRGQIVAEKLIAALRGSGTPEKQFGDTENRPEAAHDPHKAQNEILYNTLDAKYKEHRDDMQDMPGSQAGSSPWNMRGGGTAGDGMYSVEICSVDSPDRSRNSPLQDDEGDKSWVLGKRKSTFGTESEQYFERARWVSSLATSSLGEPRSRESTFEFYFTEPPQKPDCTFPDHSEKATNVAKQISCLAEETLETVATKSGKGAPLLVTDSLKEHSQNGPGHVAKYLDSSSKTIVDNNGSPRLGTPQRRNLPLVQQQPSAKRVKLPHQSNDRNVTLCAIRQNQSKNVDSPTKDSMPVAAYTDTDHGSKKDTTGTFERTIKGSGKDHNVVSVRSTGLERHLASLSPVHATAGGRHFSFKDIKTASPGLSKDGGQHRSSENKEQKPQNPTAGKLRLERLDSERTVACQLPEATARETDRQTSLQELYRTMELTLLDNNDHLSRQIESERITVNRVLNTYRQQCHTVLDQLFDAQMQRIRLCKQQIDSIKQQHADVCQGLIRCLEENERSLGAAAGSQ